MKISLYSTLRVAAQLSLLSTLAIGCALTSKGAPVVPRYFDLDQSGGGAEARSAQALPSSPAVPGEDPTVRPRLRLGDIEAAEHLDERLVFRASAREIGYYEAQRWSEQPREYLRRALGRELYEQRGLTRVVSGAAPTLEVDLSSFEEVRGTPARARVRLTYVLHDEQSVLLERTITIDRKVATARDEQRDAALVQAMADALRSAVHEIADTVTKALPVAARTAPPPGCPELPSDEPRPNALEAK